MLWFLFIGYCNCVVLFVIVCSSFLLLVAVLCDCGLSRVCLFVLRFYGPVNPMGSCRARSVYLTTCLLGRLSPLSGLPVLCRFFCQKLTTALLESTGYFMINPYDWMLPTSVGVEPATSWSPVGRRNQLSRQGRLLSRVPSMGILLSIGLDKSEYLVNIFLISPQKHMLWVFIRSASLRRF